MSNTKNVKLIQAYLESMSNFPPVIPTATYLATLRDIRPRSVTQAALAKELGRGTKTINDWEKGERLNGVNSSDILKMAVLFNRDVVEVLAAIENTRLLTSKEEN